jgi:hypothetical protein
LFLLCFSREGAVGVATFFVVVNGLARFKEMEDAIKVPLLAMEPGQYDVY